MSADYTAMPITSSLGSLIVDERETNLYSFDNAELEKATPKCILSRMLSTNSALSPDACLAEKRQRAQDDASLQTYPSIGAGQTGTIYALTGTTLVIKLPNTAEKADSVFADYKNHRAVCEAFRGASAALRRHVHVPACRAWVTPESAHFWAPNSALFAAGVKAPDYGLVSERIDALPFPVRSALVDTFAPRATQAQKQDLLRAPKNKDCLVRIYLGRRNGGAPRAPEKFHLRNFPLHVDDMELLCLDTPHYARLLAQALAILHWRARLDANDVEFVFGSAPQTSEGPTARDLAGLDKDAAACLFATDLQRRMVAVWLLDFNLCETFTEDAAGVKKLVDAFYWNDPYYPRPASADPRDRELWRVFARRYVEVSGEFVRHDMPQAFVDAVEERGTKRSVNNLFG